MSDADQERCDYRLTVGQVHDDIEAEPCERPVWEDHDRCFWHAPSRRRRARCSTRPRSGTGTTSTERISEKRCSPPRICSAVGRLSGRTSPVRT
ncbi:hypothetical protein VB773_17245 [Haloarculaceae archaeon H-GB2-1]|nr:hypothetical protein [Haloarculaceae archaeon H-GB2-1]